MCGDGFGPLHLAAKVENDHYKLARLGAGEMPHAAGELCIVV